MSLNKLNYVDQVTVIPASNLNDIQDAIIELEGDVGEIETEIEGKADADSVYTKTEADALLNAKANASETYTKTEVDTLVSGKADASSVYTKTEVDTALSGKADSSSVYTKTETDTLLSAKASASDVEELAEDVENKANINGLYPDMVVGGLIEQTGTTDKEPYQYRKSFSGAREWDTLVGGTVAWNQLAKSGNSMPYTKYGITITKVLDSPILEVQGTSTYTSGDSNFYFGSALVSVVSDHKYLFKTNSDVFCLVGYGAFTASVRRNSYIANATASGNENLAIKPIDDSMIASDTAINETVTIGVIDLTQMFGSTIADYAYNLETATAGSGVAWLKKYIDLDTHYEYSQPTLESVSGVSGHQMTGLNQMSAMNYIRGGNYNIAVGATLATNGESSVTVSGDNPISITNTTGWRGATFISDPLISGVEYQLNYRITGASLGQIKRSVYFVDENNVVVSKLAYSSSVAENENYIYAVKGTPTTSGLRLAFDVESGNAQTIKVMDMCVHIYSDGTNKAFEPYHTTTYPLDDSLTLRGIYKLDGDKLYCDGDTYASDGTVTRRYAEITLEGTNVVPSSVNQSNGTYYTVFPIVLLRYPRGINTENSKQRIANDGGYREFASPTAGNTYITNNGAYLVVCFFDQTLTTVADVSTYLQGNPITFVYEVANSTTETAEPFASPQEVDGNGTERYITTSLLPIGHDTTYKQIQSGIPNVPTANGTYTLTCVVNNGNAVVQWVQ